MIWSAASGTSGSLPVAEGDVAARKLRALESHRAGRQAANELFEIVPNLVLKAEADTIEALLKQAKEK